MNTHPLQFDAVIAAPFGAPFATVGIALLNGQVSIELLAQAHTLKPAQNKTLQTISNIISAYFANAKSGVNLSIYQQGTPFQQRVWQAISAISQGQVLTYSDIAAQIGSGARAVANACGANNLPIIVPCHRVVAKGGLGGFMQGNPQGLMIKKWLLIHEGANF